MAFHAGSASAQGQLGAEQSAPPQPAGQLQAATTLVPLSTALQVPLF